RQKVVPDGSEKGLESLGKPTNDYFKNQFSKNDKVIGIVSDGRDYSNVDFGENVGDNSLALEVGTIVETGVATGTGIIAGGVSAPVVAGIAVVGGIVYYAIMPEERKEELKREISEIYEDEKSIQKEGMAYDIGDKVEKR
ncbi:hemolysin, partial [Fusobacterium nucleatum]|nr:hemolysin [Fusobacterium nucleatum]